MNCFYHPNQPAVTTCTDCGKGLCTQCARRTQPILCPDNFNNPTILCGYSGDIV